MYFAVLKPTPILNTPHFTSVYGKALPFDDQYLVRAVEMITFPHRIFEVVSEKENNILEVFTRNYPSTNPLYIDSRFGRMQTEISSLSKKKIPSKEELIKRLLSKQGLPYVWGGNWSMGLPDWEKWYPPPESLSPFEKAHWTLRGLDCSGLLYEAAEGLTPRNTHELMTYGHEVSLTHIEALDLILYPGHVIIALSKTEVIESCHEFGGVKVSFLKERLKNIDKPFMVRRFLQTPEDTA